MQSIGEILLERLALAHVFDRAHLLLRLGPCHLFHRGALWLRPLMRRCRNFRLAGSLISCSCQAYSWRRFALATLPHDRVSIDAATSRWIHARGLEEMMDGPV